QLFSEDHAEGGLDALPDLRVLRIERDLAVWRDLHVGAGRQWRRRTAESPGRAGGGFFTAQQREAEHQPAAGGGGGFQEATTRDRAQRSGGFIRELVELLEDDV